MNISISNEHFNFVYYSFEDSPSKEYLLGIQKIFPTHILSDPNEPESILLDPFIPVINTTPWSSKLIVKFFINGVIIDSPVNNNNSTFNMNKDLNAKIILHSLPVDLFNKISTNDFLTYAKYKWCCGLGFNYFYSQQAQNIEKKIFSSTDVNNSNDIYNNMLSTFKSMNYNNYLQTDHWKYFRNEALKYYQYKCQLCGVVKQNSSDLNVHHNNYDNRGKETFNDVTLLCQNCHNSYHKIKNSN